MATERNSLNLRLEEALWCFEDRINMANENKRVKIKEATNSDYAMKVAQKYRSVLYIFNNSANITNGGKKSLFNKWC